MRKVFLFFVLLTLLFTVGCTNSNAPSENRQSSLMRIGESTPSAGDTDMQDRYDAISVVDMIRYNPSLFGNPLVFENWEDVDSTLEMLQNVEYYDIRTWCASNSFSNLILESNITYDSVWSEVVNQFGIDIDYDEIDEELMDALDSAFVQEIMTNHSVECIVSQDPTWGNVVRPIGTIGLGALCNEKDLFIVDKVVVKLVGGYIISCPMDRYAYLPSFAEWNDDVMLTLMSQIVSGQIPQISDDEIVIYKLNQQSQDDSDSPQKHHVATHGNYKLVVDIDAYPVWQWFMQTSVRGKVDIYNYYKGSRHKEKTLGRVNFDAQVVCSVESIDENHSFFWGPEAITGKYKHKSFHNGSFFCGRPRVSRTVVELTRVYISVNQERGARIDYSYN